MHYCTSTFSPAMLGTGTEAKVIEIGINDIPPVSEMTSAVSHEITAGILSALLGEPVLFRRTNLVLEKGDHVYCIIPRFRATEAREFTREEVESAGFRCFLINIK